MITVNSFRLGAAVIVAAMMRVIVACSVREVPVAALAFDTGPEPILDGGTDADVSGNCTTAEVQACASRCCADASKPPKALKIASGFRHSCAVTFYGNARCWGSDGFGQLGDRTGNGTDKPIPVDVSGLLSRPVSLDLGRHHSCALTSEGGIKCWGSGAQLGNNTAADSRVPVDVLGLTSGVLALGVGNDHSCALTSAGGVKCWGSNDNGQLGNNGMASSRVPVDVIGLTSGVTALSLGNLHSCALTSAGGVKCWGRNLNGQLGNNAEANSLIAVDVKGLSTGVTAIDIGGSHSCALTSAGSVKCWGWNSFGQLGTNSDANSLIPADVQGLPAGVVAVSLGDNHSCALTSSGGVKCWGYNVFGQLGNDSKVNSLVPVNVEGLSTGVAALSIGADHSCALTSGGGVKCWGLNNGGQLGNNTFANSLVPSTVLGF
jgi:alpha-tubulin suppressor-like RCC1 family protein